MGNPYSGLKQSMELSAGRYCWNWSNGRLPELERTAAAASGEVMSHTA
jgi:hypothetical protein